jgi:HSP20 family protein
MSNRQISVFSPRSIFSDELMDTIVNNSFMTPMLGKNKIEMYEDGDDIVVKIEAPGFKSDDFNIDIEDNVLTVSGFVKNETEEEDKKKKYYYKEISQESFSRAVRLPVRVKADNADAEYKEGMLVIRVPKAEEAKPKKITVKAN